MSRISALKAFSDALVRVGIPATLVEGSDLYIAAGLSEDMEDNPAYMDKAATGVLFANSLMLFDHDDEPLGLRFWDSYDGNARPVFERSNPEIMKPRKEKKKDE